MKDNSGLRKQSKYADDPGIVPFRKEALAEIAQSLIGLNLAGVWRGGGQCFDFGDDIPISHRGTDSSVNEVSITACDGWLLSKGSNPVMGSGDHKGYGTRRFYDRKTKPKDFEAGLRWQRAKDFLDAANKRELFVTDISAGDDAYLEIGLTSDYRIRMMTVTTDYECMHFLNRIVLKSLYVFDGMMIYEDLEQKPLVNTPRKVEENPTESTK